MARDDRPMSTTPVLDADEDRGPEFTTVGAGWSSPRHRRRRRVAVALLAVTVGAVVWGPWRGEADVRDGTTAVSRAEMATAEGVDVNLVALTAAGGLVELRMQVVDPDKAYAVLHEAGRRPVIVAEDTGETLVMAAPAHHRGELELGGQYFFLLANAHNAIHAGADVTLVIGDSRLEHVEVQG
jgi:hypothetical protein